MIRHAYRLAAAVLLSLAAAPRAGGQVVVSRDWDNGAGTLLWGDANNWNPNGAPSNIPITVGNLPAALFDTTLVDAAYSITALTVLGSADVVTSPDNGATDYELTVTGATTVSGVGSSIIVIGGDPDGLDTGTLTINSGGDLILNSETASGLAVVEVSSGLLTNNAGGLIFGNGRLELVDSVAFPTTLLNNEGTISVGNVGPVTPGMEPPRTLQITATDADARVDLDGTASNDGLVVINRSATFDVEVPLSDGFAGRLILESNGAFEMADPWNLHGFVELDTPGVLTGTASPGRIAGAALTSVSGIFLVEEDDGLAIDAPLVATGGIIQNEGVIFFNNDTTIGPGVDFNMLGDNARLTINGEVNIDVPDFRLGGLETGTNRTTISSGGILDLDLGAGADEDYSHTIFMAGGELDVTTSDNGWSLEEAGFLDVGGLGASTINGEPLLLRGDVSVGPTATLNVNTLTTIDGPSAVTIDEGGVLNFDQVTYNHAGATFTGGGTLRKGAASVQETTVWNVAVVDLDDGDTSVIGHLTINAESIDANGDGMDALIHIFNVYSLTVNIAGGDSWTVDPLGEILYTGDSTPDAYLHGSDVVINGTLNHWDDGRIEARLHVGATGVVNIGTPGEPLRLSGGDNVNNPNRLNGGVINGPGPLGADHLSALFGYGRINADIDFDGSSRLFADDGMLTVNGQILEVDLMGAFGADAILNITNPWNTSAAGELLLQGGEVRGGDITVASSGGLSGFGLVSARVINEHRITAQSGTLVVQTAGNDNDWDGAGDAGALWTNSGGILELRDNALFFFHGDAVLSSNSEIFANGFELAFVSGSSLHMLHDSRYRSTHATRFAAEIDIAAGTGAAIEAPGITIEAISNVTLDGSLSLVSPNTRIAAGATFNGGSALIVPAQSTAMVQDNADVGVLVINQGTFGLGIDAAPNGQASGLDYQQDASGTMAITLGGAGLSEFDRLTLDGAASLAGSLSLSLNGGFAPVAGQVFTILSAAGGVTGAFTAVSQPADMPSGLLFDVMYSPTLVQLAVVDAPIYSADFNLDGDVDDRDLMAWRVGFGPGPFADADNDGDSDGADFLAWQQQFGSVPAVPAGDAVPEPACGMIALGAAMFAGRLRSAARFWRRNEAPRARA
jgi:hypothetical protein